MTGSSSSTANAVPARNVQWDALIASIEHQRALFKKEPPSWWRSHAEASLDACVQAGMPTTKLEDWRYTSLAPLNAKAREAGLAPVSVAAPEEVAVTYLSELMAEGAETLVFQNKVRELLESNAVPFFENLAKGFVVDPCIIMVPPKLKSEETIDITWRSLPDGEWGLGLIIVVIGEGADVSIVERYGAEADAQTSATYLSLAAHACVSHLRVQAGDNVTGEGIVLGNTRAHVAEGAKYEVSQVSFGSRLSREDLTVELQASEAETVTDGVFIGREGQLLDHHTNLVHRVGSTTSRQLYKGILSDEARGVFNGRIAIAKNASGSNSSQMNRNLLLSKKVEIDTKPQLEIDNDDVKAAHGAAIGRLDPEHIFYLRSRGIEMGQAVEMLARGFAFEAVGRLSSEGLRAIGREEIERGLHGLSWESL